MGSKPRTRSGQTPFTHSFFLSQDMSDLERNLYHAAIFLKEFKVLSYVLQLPKILPEIIMKKIQRLF